MILYSDKDIVVCEKPYGISSQKSDKENMIDILKKEFGCEVYPIHRLDLTTTGVMVYALNEKASAFLSNEIANRNTEKRYLCICHGEMEKQGEMEDFIYHDRITNKSFVAKNKRTGAKEARLAFFTHSSSYSEKHGMLSLVEVTLFTGRTHQIRVQFSSRQKSLYGDGKYGAKDNDKIALHSYKLSFTHPRTKERLEFYSYPKGENWMIFEDDIRNLGKENQK